MELQKDDARSPSVSLSRSTYQTVSNETDDLRKLPHPFSDAIIDLKSLQVEVPQNHGLRKLLAYVGPGFLVSIAYMDPGNFESDLQAGAKYKFEELALVIFLWHSATFPCHAGKAVGYHMTGFDELLWVLVVATVAGTIIQSLASNLGVVTGKHLAEHCRVEYPAEANYVLWLLAELAIVASDIPEVIGTAYALNMLFHLELWLGVLLTGFSTLVFLALQQYGVRKLEVFIFFLVLTIASCFFLELHYAQPFYKDILYGLVVPRLQGDGAFAIAISLLGAMVMPHNLYLHSALVLTRKTPRTVQGIKDGCRYNLLECSFALVVSFIINVAVMSVSGAVCNSGGLSVEDTDSCRDLDLNRASFLLKNSLGNWSSMLFAIALLASGQSSTITGTYAGQYVMQGFLDLKFAPWMRNLFTRCVAIVPSLIVALIGGFSGAGKLIIASSMILSFELPFALLPLLKFTSNNVKMGPHVNTTKVIYTAWLIGFCVIVTNLFYLSSEFYHWIHTSMLHRWAVWMVGVIGIFSLVAYAGFICYLAMRKDRTESYVLPEMAENIDVLYDDEKKINGVELNESQPLIV